MPYLSESALMSCGGSHPTAERALGCPCPRGWQDLPLLSLMATVPQTRPSFLMMPKIHWKCQPASRRQPSVCVVGILDQGPDLGDCDLCVITQGCRVGIALNVVGLPDWMCWNNFACRSVCVFSRSGVSAWPQKLLQLGHCTDMLNAMAPAKMRSDALKH